ncbi:MAG TPA: low-specificity L-threonine aldolase [Deltaproteobacteria bacterium]|nr:low-specificity L-threonine aldolase [Deltaproteobacteria bacterium]
MSQGIDLRSDTVSLPTEAMLAAMMAAELGDDVLGDDPTVQRLEARCAALSGKEAALFVPSGTMANLIAIEVSTRRGDEVLAHEAAHPFHYEAGGAAGLAGIQLRLVPGPRGVMDPDVVAAAIRPEAPHHPRTSLLCVEDTHNRGGGRIQPLENTDALCALARERGLASHLDGARILNAVVASGVPLERRARGFDTVSFCFSKGLGCPVGSILCGDRGRMIRARRMRKMLGGATRQAGLLAAAALYALDHHVDRLAEDHRRAQELAGGLAEAGFALEPPETNILVVAVPSAPAFVERLGQHGVRCFPVADDRLRLVVHLGIDDADVQATLGAFTAARG